MTPDTTEQNPLYPAPMVRPSQERIEIAVCGAHLAGQPLNHELVERGAKLVRTARTARGYSFYVITQGAVAKPGLIFDGAGQGGIELEIWSLAPADFAAVVAEIPSPLGIGTIALADGGSVKGFLCEAYAAAGAENITSYGGWRAFRARSGAT